MKRFPSILLAPLLLAMVHPLLAQDSPAPQEDAVFKVVPDASGTAYFPNGMASYYTPYLKALEEPSLMKPLEKSTRRVIRFTLIPSFSGAMAVRFTETAVGFSARAAALGDRKEDELGRIIRDETSKPAADVMKPALEFLERKDFWKPLNDQEDAAAFGFDGDRYIFEMHDENGYQMISIWTPAAVAAITPEQFRNGGLDPTKLRDFMVYEKAGRKLLEIGKMEQGGLPIFEIPDGFR